MSHHPSPRSATTLVLLLVLALPSFAQVAPEVVDARRTAVLKYITDLSGAATFRGVISGQNCYHGNEIADNGIPVTNENNRWQNQDGYRRLVEGLHEATGQWVGILGVDYEFQRLFTPAQLSQANEVLIRYAQQNGILAVTFSPQNPWYNDETDLNHNPGTWDGPAATQNKAGFGKVRLDDLLDPSKPVHDAWMRKLDRIGAGLQQLRDAGAIVLFRPMQEMNGDWFWWGTASHRNDPAPYVRVYQAMRKYFTEDLKLNNLLWVYSPCSTRGSSGIKSVTWAYPGAAAVDIVAGTEYTDTMKIWDYSAYLTLKKPLGMGEFSPDIGGKDRDGSWDTSKIVTTIRDKYPKIAFWVSWHHYPTSQWDILSNRNAPALMNNPLVINRDQLDWTAQP